MVIDTSKLGSWKTTVAGLFGAVVIGVYPLIQGGKPTTQQILSAVAVAAVGWFAKDSNVTGGTNPNSSNNPVVVAQTAAPKGTP